MKNLATKIQGRVIKYLRRGPAAANQIFNDLKLEDRSNLFRTLKILIRKDYVIKTGLIYSLNEKKRNEIRLKYIRCKFKVPLRIRYKMWRQKTLSAKDLLKVDYK